MRLSIFLFVLVSLVGCASSPSKTVLEEDWVKIFSQHSTISNTCSSQWLLPKTVNDEYQQVSSAYLRLHDYNRVTYATTSAAQKKEMSDAPIEDVAALCIKAQTIIPEDIQYLRSAYAARVNQINQGTRKQLQQRDSLMGFLEELANTLNSVGEDAQALGRSAQQQADRSTTPSSAGSTENETKSVLINTDDGLVQCQVTESGYTFCN